MTTVTDTTDKPAWQQRAQADTSAAQLAEPSAGPEEADITIDSGQLMEMLRRKSQNLVGSLLYENSVLEVALTNAKAEILELRSKVSALTG